MFLISFFLTHVFFIQVICDHPDWWCVVSLDGFTSHLNVVEALNAFAGHKILGINEEGDTSAMNQPYDQAMAKSNKRAIREYVDVIRFTLIIVTQWDLIAICVKALAKVKPESWISSFKKVNLHPDFRVGTLDWTRHIDEKINTGDHFFTANNNSLFEAMPAFWKKLTVEAHHECIQLIDSFHEQALPGDSPWTKENAKQLIKFTSLDHIIHLCACHLVAKQDAVFLLSQLH